MSLGTVCVTSVAGHAAHNNCAGATLEDIDTHLKTLMSCFNMTVVNGGPTRMQSDGKESMLDLIIEPGHTRSLSNSTMVMIGYSDHRLVKAHLDCARPHLSQVTYTFHDCKKKWIYYHLQLSFETQSH